MELWQPHPHSLISHQSVARNLYHDTSYDVSVTVLRMVSLFDSLPKATGIYGMHGNMDTFHTWYVDAL